MAYPVFSEGRGGSYKKKCLYNTKRKTSQFDSFNTFTFTIKTSRLFRIMVMGFFSYFVLNLEVTLKKKIPIKNNLFTDQGYLQRITSLCAIYFWC